MRDFDVPGAFFLTIGERKATDSTAFTPVAALFVARSASSSRSTFLFIALVTMENGRFIFRPSFSPGSAFLFCALGATDIWPFKAESGTTAEASIAGAKRDGIVAGAGELATGAKTDWFVVGVGEPTTGTNHFTFLPSFSLGPAFLFCALRTTDMWPFKAESGTAAEATGTKTDGIAEEAGEPTAGTKTDGVVAVDDKPTTGT